MTGNRIPPRRTAGIAALEAQLRAARIEAQPVPALGRRRFLSAGIASAGLLLAAGPGRAQEAEAFQRQLTHDPDQPVIGNPEGDVTLVEFFDYQCPYCRQGHAAILDLVRADGQIRLVMKDWPIFGPVSQHGVKLALGAASIGRYEAAHSALMALEGRRIAPEAMEAALRTADVDPALALAAYDEEAARWSALIARNEAQAAAIGLGGTPAYIVGWTLLAGAYDAEVIRGVIANERG